MKLKTLSTGLVLLTLGACFHNDDDGSPAVITPDYDVLTVSGVEISLDGTWERPCEDTGVGSNDERGTQVFSGSSLIVTRFEYTSQDGSCSAGETVANVLDVTFSKGAVTAITGWVDFNGTLVAPPQAQDGSGPLSNNESVTSLTATVNSDIPGGTPAGTQGQLFNVVDDTLAGTLVMYGKSDFGDTAEINLPLTRQ